MNSSRQLALAVLLGSAVSVVVCLLATIESPPTIVAMDRTSVPSGPRTIDQALLGAPMAGSRTPVAFDHLQQMKSTADALIARDIERIRKNASFASVDASFSAKYEGLGAYELRLAFAAVEKHVNTERTRIVADRMKAGLFEERILRDGEQSPMASSKDGTPASFGFHSEPMDGFTLLRTTTIPPSEYPEFRMLELEDWWLHAQLHELEACSCNSSGNR